MKKYKYGSHIFEIIGAYKDCKNKTICKINNDFWKENKGKPGIYVLFTNSNKVNLGIKDKGLNKKWKTNKSNIVYIGSSVNVIRRLNQLFNKGPHVALKSIKKIQNLKTINVGVYFCKTKEDCKLIEKELLIDFVYKHKNLPLINKRIDF